MSKRKIFLIVSIVLIILTSCNIGRKRETITGTCKIYTGPRTNITHYIEKKDGESILISLSDGNKYVGKEIAVKVIYNRDNTRFTIESISITNSGSPDPSQENKLISGIRNNLENTDQLLEEIIVDLRNGTNYYEEKKNDLPFLQTQYREDEIVRIREMIDESKENINVALTALDSTFKQTARIDTIKWITDRKEAFSKEIGLEVENLQEKYLDRINSYKKYFDDLDFEIGMIN